jgi:hypothetical protein
MSDQNVKDSDLVEIAKRNGEFRRNYGIFVGAFLYLRSISAARSPSFRWTSLLAALAGAYTLWTR